MFTGKLSEIREVYEHSLPSDIELLCADTDSKLLFVQLCEQLDNKLTDRQLFKSMLFESEVHLLGLMLCTFTTT